MSSICCCEVKSTSAIDGGEFDRASPVEDALAASKVDIRRGEVVEAHVAAVAFAAEPAPVRLSRVACDGM